MNKTTSPAAQEAIESLRRNGLDEYVRAVGASTDGRNVIVKMTPDQVLRFIDMIFEDRD